MRKPKGGLHQLARISIDLVDHSEQRYNTCGDWFLDPDDDSHLIIRGSRLALAGEDTRRSSSASFLNWAVPVHEFCEALACLAGGVTPEMVDAFDFEWDAQKHPDSLDEPGDDPAAPYHTQHVWATHVEKVFVTEILRMNWDRYEDLIDKLWTRRERIDSKRKGAGTKKSQN